MRPSIDVSSAEELQHAVAGATPQKIIVRGRISNCPSILLQPGQELAGGDEEAAIEFVSGADGVQITAGNIVRDLSLFTSPECRAIWNLSSATAPGDLLIESVRTIGQVQILAEQITQGARIRVRNLDIVYADCTQREPRPEGFGVSVLQGAFTIWNRQSVVPVVAELDRISIGRREKPANGGGVFLAGFSAAAAGSLVIPHLTTGDI